MIKKSEEYLRIGIIVRPHGVKGTLKIEPLTFDTSRFSVLSDAFIEDNGVYKPVKVRSASFTQKTAFVDIEGIDTRDKAEMLRNRFICVDREHAAKLPDGQYFIVDLIGCEVYDTNGAFLGVLTDVMSRPANDVYEIKSDNYSLLVPALKKLLTEVDIENKRITLQKQVLDEVGLFEYKNESN